jgi:uncharacterized LabA/DUF88 family protein
VRQRTIVYVDGFNLYYRSLKGTPYKWLDLLSLCRSMLRPTNEIVLIRYFTANVSGKRDPGAPLRQQAYLRALATLPQLSIHKGRFLSTTRWAGLAAPPNHFVKPVPHVVLVERTEEKGSDVNLAAYLLRDAFRGEIDVAAVVSNDTDLVEAIRIVESELAVPVGLICPSTSAARSLEGVAAFCRHITRSRLAAAQFPDPIPGTSIRKPGPW